MPSNPRVCLSLLRIVVLALALALYPAKTQAYAEVFVETPVLVVSAAQSKVVATRPALAPRVTLSGLEPVEMHPSTLRHFGQTHLFVPVIRRFVTKCSWLC
jgi:hypothetical protein